MGQQPRKHVQCITRQDEVTNQKDVLKLTCITSPSSRYSGLQASCLIFIGEVFHINHKENCPDTSLDTFHDVTHDHHTTIYGVID